MKDRETDLKEEAKSKNDEQGRETKWSNYYMILREDNEGRTGKRIQKECEKK